MPASISGHFLCFLPTLFVQFMFNKKISKPKAIFSFIDNITLMTALVLVLNAAGTATLFANTSNSSESVASGRDLSNNECLKKLDRSDLVIASIAFKDGLNSSAQLKELLKRRPWGAVTPQTEEEIKTQLDTQSPFLIITLTKEQALTLDNHRDIIRWVLVQSTSKSCE